MFNPDRKDHQYAATDNYAARELPFPGRAALGFLTGFVVSDMEWLAGVSFESDVVRISRWALNQ
jgi:acyl dehydratase